MTNFGQKRSRRPVNWKWVYPLSSRVRYETEYSPTVVSLWPKVYLTITRRSAPLGKLLGTTSRKQFVKIFDNFVIVSEHLNRSRGSFIDSPLDNVMTIRYRLAEEAWPTYGDYITFTRRRLRIRRYTLYNPFVEKIETRGVRCKRRIFATIK